MVMSFIASGEYMVKEYYLALVLGIVLLNQPTLGGEEWGAGGDGEGDGDTGSGGDGGYGRNSGDGDGIARGGRARGRGDGDGGTYGNEEGDSAWPESESDD